VAVLATLAGAAEAAVAGGAVLVGRAVRQALAADDHVAALGPPGGERAAVEIACLADLAAALRVEVTGIGRAGVLCAGVGPALTHPGVRGAFPHERPGARGDSPPHQGQEPEITNLSTPGHVDHELLAGREPTI